MRPSVAALVTTAWCSAAAASMVPPDPSPVRRIRVCTYGGEGLCGQGGGAKTLAALRFLTPPDAGIEPSGCSCLARCDQGVAVQIEAGSVVGNVNGAREAAKLLKGLGVTAIDARLVSAFAAAARGDELMADDRPTDALNAYNRAFGLASAAGLGMRWRSRPSSVLRVRQRMGVGRERSAGAPDSGTMGAGVSQHQVMWLADLMASRSRVFADLANQARPTPPPTSTHVPHTSRSHPYPSLVPVVCPHHRLRSANSRSRAARLAQGWVRGGQRALEDAQYAVQLAETLPSFSVAFRYLGSGALDGTADTEVSRV